MLKNILLFISILFFSLEAWADTQSMQTEHTTATLVTDYDAIQPGQPFKAGVWLKHREGWHSYWENPGEAGIATSLNWTLPDAFTVSGIDWPPPQLLREGPLVVYAYHGSVLLPVTITPPVAFAEKSALLKVKAEWLVCKDICIPESAELVISLPVSESPSPSTDADIFNAAAQAQPEHLVQPGQYAVDGSRFIVSVPYTALSIQGITSAYFFPRIEHAVSYNAEQVLTLSSDTLTLATDKGDEPPQDKITGILFIEGRDDKKYFDITLTPATTSLSPFSVVVSPIITEQNTSSNVWLVLAFAITGGLILNLMPCVLPVLSLKALAIAKKAGQAHTHVMRLGIAYTLGIFVSFAVIAGLLIGLQQAGHAVGWGYQMQSPAFVGFLTYLLFLVGLNLSGVFSLPVLFGQIGSEVTNESSAGGSFMTGILAAAVATPCTAPFMAPAIGIALTLPAWKAMLVFEALGFGLALPFLLISLFPALLRFLPKPGAWMERLKKMLAWPMYASALWLLWVLGLQTGITGLALAVAGMMILMLAFRLPAPKASLALIAIVTTISLVVFNRLDSGRGMMPTATHVMETMAYSKPDLEKLRAEGKPVFVDVTAAWCITCQVNAKVAIHTERTMQLFKEKGVTLMIADWTRRNDEISALLGSFGYQGVPLYIYYPPHGEPKVLPQLLSETIIADALVP